jgi:hypothetical protein
VLRQAYNRCIALVVMAAIIGCGGAFNADGVPTCEVTAPDIPVLHVAFLSRLSRLAFQSGTSTATFAYPGRGIFLKSN